MKLRQYSYNMPHDRKCELCGCLFIAGKGVGDPKRDNHWQCPKCRKSPPKVGAGPANAFWSYGHIAAGWKRRAR